MMNESNKKEKGKTSQDSLGMVAWLWRTAKIHPVWLLSLFCVVVALAASPAYPPIWEFRALVWVAAGALLVLGPVLSGVSALEKSIFQLFEQRQTDSKNLLHKEQSVARLRNSLPNSGRAALDKEFRYRQMINGIRELVRSAVPRDANLLVISKGDDQLLHLDGRKTSHFPQAEEGGYAGYHPADSAGAISHLEDLRSKGANFLLVPETAYWWFEHYHEFKLHLERYYREIPTTEHCRIYHLISVSSAVRQNASQHRDHRSSKIDQLAERPAQQPQSAQTLTAVPAAQDESPNEVPHVNFETGSDVRRFSGPQPARRQSGSQSQINLFLPYYDCGIPVRQAEIDESLERNVRCSAIDRIFLLIDDDSIPPVADPKLTIIRVEKRPTYRDWILLTRRELRQGISILANSDISFDGSINYLKEILEPRVFVALTRYEIDGPTIKRHPTPHWSQDVWAVRANQEFDEKLIKQLDVPLGVPRCDNKAAYVFAMHGWNLINPVVFVRSYHHHETGIRGYDRRADDTVLGGVAYVNPSLSIDEFSTIQVDIWGWNSAAVELVSMNHSLDRWRASKDKHEEPANPCVNSNDLSAAMPLSAKERTAFIAQADLVFDFQLQFKVYRRGQSLLFYDALTPHTAKLVDGDGYLDTNGELILNSRALCAWITPTVNVFPILISERESGAKDLNFWQYPCSTEKQALGSHSNLQAEQCLDPDTHTFHIYLGLPWATYIDKGTVPDEIQIDIAQRIQGLKKLLEHAGFFLAVHTVCQHIRWRRLIELWTSLGVTHLHLSHFDDAAKSECASSGLVGESWPLIAVNVEVPERSNGLSAERLAKERRYLATFVGAHMPHYPTDIRLRLALAAANTDRTDILVRLTEQWHFNKVVYETQVRGQALGESDHEAMAAATYNYNALLSDSVFSLCPEGAGPNTLRIWESLAVGAIPVIISDHWIPPRLAGSELQLEDCAIFVKGADLDTLFDRLDQTDFEEREERRLKCIRLYELVRALCSFPLNNGNSVRPSDGSYEYLSELQEK